MRRFFLATLLSFALAVPVAAQQSAIEKVISSQLSAFEAGDLETAFSFASPAIKQLFKSPERFGQMVQRGYPMVWRPADVRFGPIRTEGGRTVQIVFFTDQAGQLFEAAYEMIETEKGWQINGVQLREGDLGA